MGAPPRIAAKAALCVLASMGRRYRYSANPVGYGRTYRRAKPVTKSTLLGFEPARRLPQHGPMPRTKVVTSKLCIVDNWSLRLLEGLS
jgi:hypothetical protein